MKDKPLSAGVIVVALVVVLAVAGYFLFHAATAKQKAQVDPSSAPIQAMKGIFQSMQQKQPGAAGPGVPTMGGMPPPSALPPGVAPGSKPPDSGQ